MSMADFEVRANNILTAIGVSHSRIQQFGYTDDPAEEAVSRIYGMFVTWLTACEESRLGGPFSKVVLSALPSNDDPAWPSFIEPKPSSTLKERASALWGIRVAFTHGDGDLSLISSAANRAYAQDAYKHLPGIAVVGNRVALFPHISHNAIRTIVQLHSVLP